MTRIALCLCTADTRAPSGTCSGKLMRARIRFALVSSLAALAACSRDGGEPVASTHASRDDASVGTFTVIATDAGFEAPAHVSAGLRHIVYENHGSQIHEAMFVMLAPGMTARDYVSAVQG